MSKKQPEYKPFSGVTCQRIRNLIGEITRTESERKTIFDARDHAREELAKLADGGESSKRQRLNADYGECCIKIDQLATDLKYYRNQLNETVEKADQPGLWETAEIDRPVPGAKPEEDDDEEGEGDGAKKDTRPVGRPPKQPKAPAAPEGVDEHLKVAVKELDLPERMIGRLVNVQLEQIADVALAIDNDDHIKFESFSDPELVQIKKAVTKYRTKHRQADREVTANPLPFLKKQA